MGLEKTSYRASALDIAHLHGLTLGFKVKPSVSAGRFFLGIRFSAFYRCDADGFRRCLALTIKLQQVEAFDEDEE